LVTTARALRTLDLHSVSVSLARHANCDWGDVCEEDKESNDKALVYGGRLLSVYKDSTGKKFWINTEADRKATTVLLPEDY
jgi:hypothetical protein